jgi:hypothetical protein
MHKYFTFVSIAHILRRLEFGGFDFIGKEKQHGLGAFCTHYTRSCLEGSVLLMILALAYRKGSSRFITVVLSQPHTRLLLTVGTPRSYVSVDYLASAGTGGFRRTELAHGDCRVEDVHTGRLLDPPVPSRLIEFSGY